MYKPISRRIDVQFIDDPKTGQKSCEGLVCFASVCAECDRNEN
jgi:hypothetical protein